MKKLLLLSTMTLLLSMSAFAQQTDSSDGTLCDTERSTSEDVEISGGSAPATDTTVTEE